MKHLPPTAPAEAEEVGFNFGYDEILHVLVFSLWDNSDGPWDCSLQGADAVVTYGVEDDDEDVSIVVTELSVNGEAPRFNSTDDEAVPPIESLEYAVDNECTIYGMEIAGPNGQINHGMFMKLFNSMWEGGPGRGCVNRHLAQSGLGKGDQQITVSEAEEADFTQVADGDTGEVSFSTVLADCQRGKGRHSVDTEDLDGDDSHPGHGRGHGKARGHGPKSDDVDAESDDAQRGNGRGNGNGNNGNGNGRGHDK